MKRLAVKDYILPMPRHIYYDYEAGEYTTVQPPNTVDYDTYDIVMTEKQEKFDKEPHARNNFKNLPSQVTRYVNEFGEPPTNDMFIDWYEFKSACYHAAVENGHADIDLVINSVL